MAEAFVELGAEGINHLTENYYDSAHDKVREALGRKPKDDKENEQTNRADVKKKRSNRRYELPSPERDRDYDNTSYVASQSRRRDQRDESLERQSETSERVTRKYENERVDPVRPVESVLPASRRKRDSARMSYANGYAPADRPRSHDPPRNRGRDRDYDDDEDSDYDDRSGRRYGKSSGRGYDDRDGDREYEVTETERYRGPAGAVSGALVVSLRACTLIAMAC